MPVRVEIYQDARGREPVAEYVVALARRGERQAVLGFERCRSQLAEEGAPLGMPRDRIINRRERLYELRFGDHRVAYVPRNAVVYLLHAWRKQTQKLDRRAEAVALRRAERLQTATD